MSRFWRLARPADDDAVVAMCLALGDEDPGPEPMSAAQVRRTLATFRREPVRGRALVLEVDGRVVGYALLAAVWSNELGGEVCILDELYVRPAWRGRGHATSLIESLARPDGPWPGRPVALALETTPANTRARSLYARLGFVPVDNMTMRRRLAGATG